MTSRKEKDMKKIFLLVLTILFISLPTTIKGAGFDEEIKDAYQVYYSKYFYETDNYSLSVYCGIVNDEATYAISFISSRSKEYTMRLSDGENAYEVKPYNGRGDIKIIALEKQEKDLEIIVYRGNNKQSLPKKLILEKVEKEEILLISNILDGNNKGCKVTKLNENSVGTILLLMIGSICVIAGCGIIILVIFILKKGMFDQKKRKEGVFNFKEFINQPIEEAKIDQFEVIETEPIEEEEIPTEREIYSKMNKYDDEERSEFPLSEYLRDKEFMTDYKIASEEEKQQIMLELMRLRDEKKITNDDYLEEAYKLWKE